MTVKKRQLIEEMARLLKDEEKPVFMPVTDFLIELGYLPERRKVHDFSLAFKHKVSKKIMARFDMRQIRKQTPFPLLSIKFFGVKDVPPRYMEALEKDLRDGHHDVPRSVTEKNRCDRCGAACTGGGLGYYYQYPDGREVLRCGAYPVPVNDLTLHDVEEMKVVIRKQHEYFLTIT